jgi:hypothetical protein
MSIAFRLRIDDFYHPAASGRFRRKMLQDVQ